MMGFLRWQIAKNYLNSATWTYFYMVVGFFIYYDESIFPDVIPSKTLAVCKTMPGKPHGYWLSRRYPGRKTKK
jgi:positive regulator of sigma E activity